MSINAMKLALESLEDWKTYMHGHWDVIDEQAVTALRQAIAEAEKQDGNCQQCGGKGCVACDAREQEPVAWVDSDWHYQLHKKGMVIAHKDKSDVLVGEPQPLYTYPQQWVGITDEEFEQMLTDAKFTRSDLLMIGACVEDICNMVEAKLRERNT